MENKINTTPTDIQNYFKRVEQDDIFAQLGASGTAAIVLIGWIFSVIFANLFVLGGFGIGVPILTAAFFGFVIPYFAKKQPLKASSYFLAAAVMLLAVGTFLHDNTGVHLITLLVLIVLIALTLCQMSGTGSKDVFSMQNFYQAVISVIDRPFRYLDLPFLAAKKGFKGKKLNSKVGMLVLGLIIAIPFAAIFILLLSRADAAFDEFTTNIFDKLDLFSGDTISSIILGTLIAIYLCALLITLRGRPQPEGKDININFSVNGILVSTVLTVINAVVVLFALMQFKYLFAGAALPEGMTHAEYARTGFFELCTAIAFSVAIMFFCIIFVEKINGRLPLMVKIMLSVFIGCNFIMIASAFYRMLNYIAVFDFTVKRLLVTWLIAIFAICMIGALIKLWAVKYRFIKHIAVTVIAMTLLLNLINVNSFIANYNVDRHIQNVSSGKESNLDVYYLRNLGTGATRATYRLLYEGGKDTRYLAKENLIIQAENLKEKDWQEYSLTDITAREILKDFS